MPAAHLAHFIDAVRKLIPAIFDVYRRRRVWQVAAVDISNAGQFLLALADAERLQLAVQRRALHPDELGGARDVAAETVDLRCQILALKDLARAAEIHRHQVLAADASWGRRQHFADLRR